MEDWNESLSVSVSVCDRMNRKAVLTSTKERSILLIITLTPNYSQQHKEMISGDSVMADDTLTQVVLACCAEAYDARLCPTREALSS
jgi:hypothetical protein